MAFDGILVTEIFESLQGETSLSGIPFTFIRLTGCNLRCVYCDSAYAFKGGEKYSIPQLVAQSQAFGHRNVLITGGEPLIQRNTPALVEALSKAGFEVSVETHGEVSIGPIAGKCRIVMDIKTPGSGMNRGFFMENIPMLKAADEVKFVICSEEDYFWTKELISNLSFPTRNILFSPVIKTDAIAEPGYPGDFASFQPSWLADQIIKDRLPVRMQLQLHKIIWPSRTEGV